MKFFIIAAQSPNEQQQNAISNYFNGAGYSYWHWLPDFWIIGSPYRGDDAGALRDRTRILVPGVEFLVIGVDPRDGEWASFSNPDWGTWLDEHWKKS